MNPRTLRSARHLRVARCLASLIVYGYVGTHLCQTTGPGPEVLVLPLGTGGTSDVAALICLEMKGRALARALPFPTKQIRSSDFSLCSFVKEYYSYQNNILLLIRAAPQPRAAPCVCARVRARAHTRSLDL